MRDHNAPKVRDENPGQSGGGRDRARVERKLNPDRPVVRKKKYPPL
jgi:hypothetical protein